MVILITGADTFRSKEKAEELRQAFQRKFDPSGFNVSSFPDLSGKAPTPADVFQQASSVPFLGQRRMVVVRDLIGGTKKATEEAWADVCSRVPEYTVLVVWESADSGEFEKKNLFKKILSLPGCVHYEFPLLQGRDLEQWIAVRIRNLGASAEPEAVRALAQRVGSDLWRMNGEIEKLAAYARSRPVVRQDVEELVQSAFASRIFDFMDAVASRRGPIAIKLLEEERRAGTADGMLFHMLVRHVRLLLGAAALLRESPRAAATEAAQALGAHPFAARKALSQARSFRLETLVEAHRLFCRLDAGMKTGRYTDRAATETAVTTLLTLPT